MDPFRKIPLDFYTSTFGKRIIKNYSSETLCLALYLSTNHHSHMLGIYHLPIPYIAADLNWPAEQVEKCLEDLIQLNFCYYDKQLEYIWVCDMGKTQVSEVPLKQTDKRVIGLNRRYKKLPNELDFINIFLQFYQNHFHLTPLENPAQLPATAPAESSHSRAQRPEEENLSSPSLLSTEKILKQEENVQSQPTSDIFPLEKRTEETANDPTSTPSTEEMTNELREKQSKIEPPTTSDTVLTSNPPQVATEEGSDSSQVAKQAIATIKEILNIPEKPEEKIFRHWLTTFELPSRRLDPARQKVIAQALSWGYSEKQLSAAISGCAYYLKKQPDPIDPSLRGLSYIFRDPEQIQRLVDYQAAIPENSQIDCFKKHSRSTQNNIRQVKTFLENLQQGGHFHDGSLT